MQVLRLILILLIPFYVMLWLLLLFRMPLLALAVLVAALAILTLALLRYTRRLEAAILPAQSTDAEPGWLSLRLIGADLLGILIGAAILILLAVFLSLFIPHAGLH